MGAALQVVQIEEIKILAELERRRLEEDFGSFVREAWKVLHPAWNRDENERLRDGWYIDAITDYCQAVANGKITRLIVNQPPRTLKSTIITIMYPCWVWTTKPWMKFIFYTYAFDMLSTPQSIGRRNILQAPWYRERWGSLFQLSVDENMKTIFSNTAGGRMAAVSQATGSGGGCVIIDDPHSVEQAESEKERESRVFFVRQGLMTRLDNPATDSVIVVMQRLHEGDVTGSLLKDKNWTHLCLQADAEDDQKVYLPSCKRTLLRKRGDRLSETLSDEVLQERRLVMGDVGYAGQYQQRPAPRGGNIFKDEWWKWWDPNTTDWTTLVDQVVITCDPSVKVTDSGSDAAIQAWGMRNVRSYLLERDTRKMNFATNKARLRVMAQKYRDCGFDPLLLVEDKSNGPALIDEFKTEFNVIPYNPGTQDKSARASTCSPTVEAGNVFLPINPDGLYIQRQASMFPNVQMKDDIDAMANFLNWRRNRGSSLGWLKAAAEQAEKERGNVQNPPDPMYAKTEAKALHEAANESVGIHKPTEKREIISKVAPTECMYCKSEQIFVTASGVWCRSCGKRY